MNNFKSEIEGLSINEKVELLDVLWKSLDAESGDLTEAQRAELDSRLAHHEQNPLDVVPWEQVKKNLFKRP